MGIEIIEGVYFLPLPPLKTTGGSVLHAIKGLDEYLTQFGECYFSTAKEKDPKAWKKHTRMTCNLFVPQGAVHFVFYDDRKGNSNYGAIKEFTLSVENYGRLVIKPGIWFGFTGIAKGESTILNVSDIRHDPEESIRLEPGTELIPYNWLFND